jgi:hypothetical protein
VASTLQSTGSENRRHSCCSSGGLGGCGKQHRLHLDRHTNATHLQLEHHDHCETPAPAPNSTLAETAVPTWPARTGETMHTAAASRVPRSEATSSHQPRNPCSFGSHLELSIASMVCVMHAGRTFNFWAHLTATRVTSRQVRVRYLVNSQDSHWRAGRSASARTPIESICDLALALCPVPRVGHGVQHRKSREKSCTSVICVDLRAFVGVCVVTRTLSPLPSGEWEGLL